MADNDTKDGNESAANQLQELESMKVIATVLAKLDNAGVARVLRWAADAFKAKPGAGLASEPAEALATGHGSQDLKPKYDSMADFYSAASPSQANDKALVMGYWLQIMQDGGDFDAQSVNKELKNLGHGVPNITSAFNSLIARKPQLVIQTKKSGTTQQARKLYKLTLEGQRAVERMLGGNQ